MIEWLLDMASLCCSMIVGQGSSPLAPISFILIGMTYKMKSKVESRSIDEEFEYMKCLQSPIYFIRNYVSIFSAEYSRWIPFDLWPRQGKMIVTARNHVRMATPKGRQVGATWTWRGYYLWKAVFLPIRNIAFFSKSDADAVKLLSAEKGFKGMYNKLPDFIKPSGRLGKSNDHLLVLPNQSMIECRPYTQAESDTYTDVMIDECDRFPPNRFRELIGALEPALEKSGKTLPMSPFLTSRGRVTSCKTPSVRPLKGNLISRCFSLVGIPGRIAMSNGTGSSTKRPWPAMMMRVLPGDWLDQTASNDNSPCA